MNREHNLCSTTVEGAAPMTTVTVQMPERQTHALKPLALERKTTVKALMIKAIDDLLVVSKQPNFTACWIAEAGHGKETP